MVKNKNRGGIPVHHPRDMKEFRELNQSLNQRRYIAIDALRPGLLHSITLGDRDTSETQAQDMATCMGARGTISNGPLAKVAWSFDSSEKTPTTISKDGKPLGRGYIKWGAGDNLPSQIYALSKALPYTAAPLRYLSDLATGLGVRMMYQFEDETMCLYEHAGYRILQRIEALKKDEPQDTYGGDFAQDPDSQRIMPIGELDKEKRPDPLLRGIGIDYWRDAYREWQRTWEGEDTTYADGTPRHIPGLREFLENNDLDLNFLQCMKEDQMFDLYFPTVGFERGRRGQWDPRIVRIGFLSIVHGGIRYEVMNEYRHIQNIYFGEKFRGNTLTEGHTVSGKDEDVVMYPVAEATRRLEEWRYQVESNQRTRIKDRPVWVTCPIYYGTQNYYQQPDWWSIILSKAYDFSSTILFDKAKQRENSTSWGKIIYISLDYLNMIFADEGIEGDKEKQQKFIDELDQNVEQFLQQRENNGKMMRQFMWPGQDEKEHHNIEIVDVAQTRSDVTKAGKEELELSTSPIFLAFGVDPRDIGVPMVSASNGGTALREIRLMKQQLLNVRQRAYLRFLRDVCTFNRYDRHCRPVVMQQTFTTLDASKTGTKETVAGEGA